MPSGIYQHKPHSQSTRDKIRLSKTQDRVCKKCGVGIVKKENWGNYSSLFCRDHYNEHIRGKEYSTKSGRTEKRRQQFLQATKRMMEKYPEKWEARKLLREAVRMGKVIKSPCEECGEVKSEGHHPDYKYPLKVNWYCRKCHALIHRKYKLQPLIQKIKQ